MEGLDAVPVALAAAVGPGAQHRAAGEETDEVLAACVCRDGLDRLRRAGQRAAFVARARCDGVGQQQERIFRHVVERREQARPLRAQRGDVGVGAAGERERRLGAASARGDAQRDMALVDVRRLPHPGVVEAHEVRSLGLQPERDDGLAGARRAQRVGERIEAPALDHHDAAPNTSALVKRHAGAAWPTRITCDGSPLPQNGVPITSKVLVSPTAASERQNVAETPR